MKKDSRRHDANTFKEIRIAYIYNSKTLYAEISTIPISARAVELVKERYSTGVANRIRETHP